MHALTEWKGVGSLESTDSMNVLLLDVQSGTLTLPLHFSLNQPSTSPAIPIPEYVVNFNFWRQNRVIYRECRSPCPRHNGNHD
jgi:hypothetical protein